MGLLKWLKSSVAESRAPTAGPPVVADPAPRGTDAGMGAPRDQVTGQVTRIEVLVSDGELARIKAEAAAERQDVSQWCRRALLAHLADRADRADRAGDPGAGPRS